jgi:predicted aspartyl protease
MLRGRFGNTSGRPYIEGRLVLPRLKITSDISFCVDTGADNTLLMPGDALRMGIDYAQLTGDSECMGIGGISHNFQEQAILVFLEPKRSLYVYVIDIAIAAAAPELLDIPSLLGRDILNRWRMSYNASNARLVFHVLSADEVIPLPAS